MVKRVLIGKRMAFLERAERALSKAVELVYAPTPSVSDLVASASDVHGIVAGKGVPITAEVIAAASRLKVIATPTAGYDEIDVAAATAAGVAVLANTGVAPRTVAEFTAGLVIALGRRIVRADRALHTQKNWAVRPQFADARLDEGVELTSCTAGIVGVGQIGSATARILHYALGMRVIGLDPYLSDERAAALGIERAADLKALARASDFLILHTMLTPETRGMIDAAVFAEMQPTAFLVNVARGEVVDEPAMIAALQAGRIAGAALDVFAQEPLPSTSPLFEMENVILSPHIAGVTVQGDERRADELAERLLGVLAGTQPAGMVNPEAWPGVLARLDVEQQLAAR